MSTNTRKSSILMTVKNYDYWFIFLFSYLYIRWDLLWTGSGFGVSLFTILFCTFFYLRLNAGEPIPEDRRRSARPWLVIIVLSAFSCTWFDYSNLSWMTFLFLTVAFLYWSLILSGKRILPALTAYLPMELFTALITVPFANFGRFFGAIFRTKSYREAIAGESHRHLIKNVLMILLTLVILGPLLLIVLNLLASADVEFMHMIADLIDHIFDLFDDIFSVRIMETLWELLLAIPVACYLFGLLWAHTRPESAKGWFSKDRVDHLAASTQFVPRIMIYTGLGLFSGIYLLFLGLQAAHLIDALAGGLPESTTYSAFARQGFFELCAVAFINLMIMTGTWLVASRKRDDGSEAVSPALRLLLALLSLQTILLVVTAMVKMGLYIETYGLTRLRVYTSWFMIWLLLIFAILGITHLRQSFLSGNRSAAQSRRVAPAKAMVILTVTMFLALSYFNVDGLVVRDNLTRYSSSEMSLEELDLYGLIHLSDNAAMEVLDYYEEHLSAETTGREGRLLEEIGRWISLVEPKYRLSPETAHWTVTSLRLNQRLEQLKSQ